MILWRFCDNLHKKLVFGENFMSMETFTSQRQVFSRSSSNYTKNDIGSNKESLKNDDLSLDKQLTGGPMESNDGGWAR